MLQLLSTSNYVPESAGSIAVLPSNHLRLVAGGAELSHSAVLPRRATYLWAQMALALLLAVGVTLTGWRAFTAPGGSDAAAMYYGSRAVLHGHNPYDDSAAIRDWASDHAPLNLKPGLPARKYPYPPICALLAAPVTLLPWKLGLTAISALSFMALVGCLCIFRRMADRRWTTEALLFFAVCLFYIRPLRTVLWNGQSTLLVCLPLAAGLLAYMRRRDFLAGALFGLSLAKFTLSLPLLLLLAYRREGKVVFAALAVFVVVNAALATTWGQPQRLLTDYLAAVRETTRPGGVNDPTISDYTDVTSAEHLAYALLGSRHKPLARILAAAIIPCAILLLIVPLRPRRTRARSFHNPLEISVMMLAGLCLFYHRYYDLTALIFVLYGLIDYRFHHPGPATWAWKTTFGLLMTMSFAVAYNGRLTLTDGGHALLPSHQYNSAVLLLLFCSSLWLLWEDRNRVSVSLQEEKLGAFLRTLAFEMKAAAPQRDREVPLAS